MSAVYNLNVSENEHRYTEENRKNDVRPHFWETQPFWGACPKILKSISAKIGRHNVD